MPQPFSNIESLENVSQIVSKEHRSSESYTTESMSRDKGRASVSKGVGSDTAKHEMTPKGLIKKRLNNERKKMTPKLAMYMRIARRHVEGTQIDEADRINLERNSAVDGFMMSIARKWTSCFG